MKYYFFLFLLVLTTGRLKGQELFVFSEPASNMPARSIGIRLTQEGNINNTNGFNRTMPELMIGFNKNLMTHLQGFFSNATGDYKLNGGSFYAKYRFLSVDGLKTHNRAAAFARISTSNRNAASDDINLEGDNSGVQGGLIFTRLMHKLALSGTVSYVKAFDNTPPNAIARPDQMINYSLSSGYLVLPVAYKNYKEPNFNLYFEVLGSTNPANGDAYLDFAPAVQVVLNSLTRIDLGYRFQVSGDMMNRYNKNMYLARVEFNFFNALK